MKIGKEEKWNWTEDYRGRKGLEFDRGEIRNRMSTKDLLGFDCVDP